MSRFRVRWGIVAPVLAAALAFGAVSAARAGGYVPTPTVKFSFAPRPGTGYQPSYRLPREERRELAMIYFSQSGCAACNQETLPAALEAAKQGLARRAEASRRALVVVGVSLDWDPERGYEHLRRFGRFDEVSAGRSWINSSAMHYVWQDLPGISGTPQIVVVERTFRPATELGEAPRIVGERVVLRKLGYVEIETWAKQGAPLPAL